MTGNFPPFPRFHKRPVLCTQEAWVFPRTVFGQVTQGQDVVNATQQGDQLESVTIAES